MESIKLLFICVIYLLLNSDLLCMALLNNISGATTIDGNLTNKGEIIKFIIFVVCFIGIDMTF